MRVAALPRRGRRAPRLGFTLVELMIALVLVGIVGGTVMTLLLRQQRFYRAAGELVQTRSQIRQAIAILPNDLRGLSAPSLDVTEMRDSMIDFLAPTGSGIICSVDPAAGGVQNLYLAPTSTVRGAATNWSSAPQKGDLVAVLDDGTGAFRAPVSLVADAGGAVTSTLTTRCTGLPYTDPVQDAGKARIRITIPAPVVVAPQLGPVAGAPVRFLRRVRYSLYKEADQQWYLGYREHDGAAFGPARPVSGPYRPYATDTTSGLTFTYYDVAGAALAPTGPRDQIARIEVSVRGVTKGSRGLPGATGLADGRYTDSDRFFVAIRNRW
jgi:prepilin-type N-terminal cleavage/methylation domain-containing protein